MPRKPNPKSKLAFIRSLPVDLPLDEVMAKAKEAGFSFERHYIYKARSLMKASKARKAGKATKSKKVTGTAAAKPAAAKKGAKPGAGKMSSSEYIRSQPATLTAKQVSEKAAAEGYAIKPALVYVVRYAAKTKAKKKAPATKRPSAAAHKPTTPQTHGAKMTSTDFIRTLPSTLSAGEAIAAGKAAGYKFSSALVYHARKTASKGKRGRRKGSKAAATRAMKAAPAARSATPDAVSKAAFRKLMIRIGLDYAEALYAEVRAELKAIESRA